MPELRNVGQTQVGAYVRPRFGVEIEFTNGDEWTSEEDIVSDLNRAGLVCEQESYNHNVRGYWKMTTDSSVGGVGLELVSPPMGFEDRHAIGTAMRIIRANGGRVTNGCGFHVHHEWPWNVAMRGRRPGGANRIGNQSESGQRTAQLLWMYDKYLPLIGVLIPKNRLTANDDNRFARSNKTIPITSQWGGDRYVAVNFTPLSDGRNTIEFRQHQGTLNPEKALAWLEFTRSLIGTATNEWVERTFNDERYDEENNRYNYPTSYPLWVGEFQGRVGDVMNKITDQARKYIVQRCADKGTTLDDVMALVEKRMPDDPWSYGYNDVISKHNAEVAETLGAAQFEPSDR